ncbi:hypothetical protein GGS23DRAFT_612392 [Durotheca rogersii]|uniref:uncharacterized protein n=1 Tax=Durotheca rogersii TaxID=419775 RepID=UPI0022211CB3|nr:uncharacterized protein GGS23DRAFT_612392 [Durotheca rogersii]KAI5867273.1 hypothetical protein GGS23DRAFT_612392 [Durotheca rogersii]
MRQPDKTVLRGGTSLPRPFASGPPPLQHQLREREAPARAAGTGTPKRGRPRSRALLVGAGLCAGVGACLALLRGGGGPDNDILSATDFRAFAIVAREAVSPSAFELAVRADGPGAGSGPSPALARARAHGLWSVEVKQPQLQIARHYTPLPSPRRCGDDGDDGDDDDDDDNGRTLRFLVRRVAGGEVSTYLSKLRVGDRVWLRGPHLGFDVGRRRGGAGNVVFLAGGTGIAPALQIAARLLDGGSEQGGPPDVSVSILWANRYAADALGRPQARGGASSLPRWWWSLGRSQVPEIAEAAGADSVLAHQIRGLQRRHPDHFHIAYFVDDEGTAIGARDVRLACDSGASPVQLPPANPSCPWHSPAALEQLPDDKDAGRHREGCVCRGPGVGADLLCVSGPDGFVAAYGGPKVWRDGAETQGPVRGMLGQILAEEEEKGNMRNWLVLKL